MWKVALFALAAASAVASTMVGGFQDADPNDEGVKNALNFAVVQHNRASNDIYLSQVAEVVKVQRQVSGRPRTPTRSGECRGNWERAPAPCNRASVQPRPKQTWKSAPSPLHSRGLFKGSKLLNLSSTIKECKQNKASEHKWGVRMSSEGRG